MLHKKVGPKKENNSKIEKVNLCLVFGTWNIPNHYLKVDRVVFSHLHQ